MDRRIHPRGLLGAAPAVAQAVGLPHAVEKPGRAWRGRAGFPHQQGRVRRSGIPDALGGLERHRSRSIVPEESQRKRRGIETVSAARREPARGGAGRGRVNRLVSVASAAGTTTHVSSPLEPGYSAPRRAYDPRLKPSPEAAPVRVPRPPGGPPRPEGLRGPVEARSPGALGASGEEARGRASAVAPSNRTRSSRTGSARDDPGHPSGTIICDPAQNKLPGSRPTVSVSRTPDRGSAPLARAAPGSRSTARAPAPSARPRRPRR